MSYESIPDCLYAPEGCLIAGCTTPLVQGIRRYLTRPVGETGYAKLVRLCSYHAPGRAPGHLTELSATEYQALWKDRLEFERHHGGALQDGWMTVDEEHPGHRVLVQAWVDECASRLELADLSAADREYDYVDAHRRYVRSPIVLYQGRSTFTRIRGVEGRVSWMTYASELLRSGRTKEDRQDVGVVENAFMNDIMREIPDVRVEHGRRSSWDRTLSSSDGCALAAAVVQYERRLRDENERAVVLVHAL